MILPKVIRKTLREMPDGMTHIQLAQVVNKKPGAVTRALNRMPDAYIDRWTESGLTSPKFSPVWCVANIPQNCPRPDFKKRKNHV